MKELDQRYKHKGIIGSSCTPSKPRRLGNPSVSISSVGAPEWILYIYIYYIYLFHPRYLHNDIFRLLDREITHDISRCYFAVISLLHAVLRKPITLVLTMVVKISSVE